MDTRNIDLVSIYENLMEIPEHDRTTAYSLSLGSYYIKPDDAMEKAREIKVKALKFLEISSEEFAENNLYARKEEIQSAMVEKMMQYDSLLRCTDFKYLLQNLSHSQLKSVEDVLKAYPKKIELQIPRQQESMKIDFEGDFRLIKHGAYEETGIEIDVLKWREDLEDTGYLVEIIKMTENQAQEFDEASDYEMSEITM